MTNKDTIMYKILLLASFISLEGISLKAQINIGGSTPPDASAMLQVSGTTKGFLPPVLGTTQRDAIVNPAKGLQIFNSTSNQMEVNIGIPTAANWVFAGYSAVVIAQSVNVSSLGYSPSASATATTAAATVTAASTSAVCTRVSTCYYAGHSYAAYSVLPTKSLTWYDAYNLAKGMGGYLATFTSLAEWSTINSALLVGHPPFDTQGCWIGMAKVSSRGGTAIAADVMVWITAELSLLDYSGGGNTNIWFYNNFASGQPDNASGTEGFATTGLITSMGLNSTGAGAPGTSHGWSDANPLSTSIGIAGGFIVEFTQ